MAHQTQDDGFHEIQLNGKQLVFLFMAATVVSVVIFLCGVLVGRGVRAERGVTAETALSGAPPVEAAPQAAPTEAPAGSDPTAAAPPPAVDDLSYFNRLENQDAPAEELKPAAERAAPEPPAPTPEPARKSPAATPPATPGGKEPAPTRAAEAPPIGPAGQGYALQIAALRERGEAEAIAKRLSSKGYSAFVLTPAAGTPPVYRVRVGTFKTRREAESVAARLQKEEQFKPWITR